MHGHKFEVEKDGVNDQRLNACLDDLFFQMRQSSLNQAGNQILTAILQHIEATLLFTLMSRNTTVLVSSLCSTGRQHTSLW
jgi:hypothetical protein